MIRDDIVLLDNKTFDYIDKENIYVVEKDMAEIIRILNKKGYKTVSETSGIYEGYPIYKTIVKDNYIVNEKLKKYQAFLDIGISFSDKYYFDTLPDKFIMSATEKDMRCKIYYFKDNSNELISEEILENERKKCLKSLQEWSEKLPINRNEGMDYRK